ncbi:MAG: hypothetical protein IPG60_02775 [Bacteroidetes bacterium]|nr:hypothetical protein [Bacteroidota bacterium]MBP7399880.1 hypothetical protein [Chitinophagales bacterium]MBK8486159.1 hypothetical protein [Bacteroidota bacterium]MBK8681105.1 hypothetical protein [Bacteroidota bacterium]MBP8754825.1 hypothetical protein [Chitinophagales bacterium]
MYDKFLYPSEVKGLLGENISPEDSAQFVNSYIDNWIQQNIILKIAEDNLQQELPNINRQAIEYKESLLIYAYEKYWLTQNLDTIIKSDSLQAYYNSHLQDFILQTDIYKLSYAVIPIANSKYDSLYFWFNKDIAKYRNELESFCLVNCSNYVFESQQWMNSETLFNILPASIYADENMRSTKTIESKDEKNRYLVKVHTFMKAGEQAPFEYVQEDIRRIMINSKKIALLKRNYQKIVTEALRINNAEIYKNE